MAGRGGNGSGRPFEPGNPWRFRPGQSGNPSGRRASADAPAKYYRVLPDITADLVVKYNEPCDVKPFAGLGLTFGQVFVLSLYINSIKGKSKAIEVVTDRIWGKVPLPIKFQVPDEPDEDMRTTRGMTDAELEQLERLEEAAGTTLDRQRELFESVRRRLEGIVDVEAREVQPPGNGDGDGED